MEVTLPVYVQSIKRSGEPVFECRPLFHSAPVTRHEHLRRAIEKLAGKVKEHLDKLALAGRQDELAGFHYFPQLSERRLKLTLQLRDHTEKCKLLFVVVESLGRRVAFTPSIPELWFELASDDLEQRATAVLTEYFLKLLKQDDSLHRPAEALSLHRDAWVEHLDIMVRNAPRKPPEERRRQSLWDTEEMDGWQELSHVGRCLDAMYPEDLNEAAGRDEVVDRLYDALRSRDRRPVLLVGRRLSGKTTVIHQVVRQRIQRRRRGGSSKRNVWLLSPQRLISGMSYVGQWENRLLAILTEARRRSHVLYFNDLLGLFRAGISRDSSLCVADVLRTWIQDRQVRVLGEITPEALHALAERDRGLHDEFQILRIEETNESDTLRIAIGEIRRLEARQKCMFAPSVLPTVVSLQRRFVADACFPGKAAKFLKQLAAKYQREVVSRDKTYEEFHNQTGLSLALLDDREKLSRSDVVQWMQTRIIGQPDALEATADVVSVAKARLNAPDRPLAAFVFLGPTGVGKTQCAKTITEYLFGSQNRLLRFDMNQYTTPAAVAQLTGSFDNPEGHLTSRVRHQPYSVVLLDEIEKAHPDVFDLLLQVLGEGRLTDSLGRTTDFTNTIVVMTSNLGVRDSQQQVGFGAEEQRQTFYRAAERFFRPEFINRIDRVIPFSRLSRGDIESIAERLLVEVLGREGIVRRRCVLHVDEQAMQTIVEAGYHPHLGARALKRSIETQLTIPLSHELASLNPDSPTLIQIYPGRDGLRVVVESFTEAEPVAVPEYARRLPADSLQQLEQQVEQCQRQLQRQRPGTTFTAGQLTPLQLRYFAAEEQAIQVRQLIEQLGGQAETAPDGRLNIGATVPSYAMRRYGIQFKSGSDRRVLREIAAAEDIQSYFNEVGQQAADIGDREARFRELLGETALLQAMANGMTPQLHEVVGHGGGPDDASAEEARPADDASLSLESDSDEDEAIVLVRTLRSSRTQLSERMFRLWTSVFAGQFQLDVDAEQPSEAAGRFQLLRISGPFSRLIAGAEHGVHLICDKRGALEPLQFCLLGRDLLHSEAAEASLPDVAKRVRAQLEQWRSANSAGRDVAAPLPLGEVLRIYQEDGPVVDLRSGQTLAAWPEAATLRRLITCSWPLLAPHASPAASANSSNGPADPANAPPDPAGPAERERRP